MIKSLDELSKILEKTELACRQLAELKILNTDERAFVVEVNLANSFQSWEILLDLKSHTGRHPIIIASLGKGSKWINSIVNDTYIFSRNGFEDIWDDNGTYRKIKRDIAPRSIINRSEALEIDTVLTTYSKAEEETEWRQVDLEKIEWQVNQTKRYFGVAPSVSAVINALDPNNKTITQTELEAFLFKWEQQHANSSQFLARPDPTLKYLSWYEPSPDEGMGIMLLPTLSSWHALAYMSFWGAEGSIETEKTMTILKSWNQRFGTELVAHYGTILNLLSQRIPSIEQTFQLAWEQDCVASCTIGLSDISLRELARALLHTKRWFLHARP